MFQTAPDPFTKVTAPQRILALVLPLTYAIRTNRDVTFGTFREFPSALRRSNVWTNPQFVHGLRQPSTSGGNTDEDGEGMQGRAGKRDYWLLSIVPFAAGLLLFMAKENGIVFSLPFSVSTLGLPDPNGFLPSSPHWSLAFQSNGLALGAIVAATIVGVLVFTWVALIIIDAKRSAAGWIEKKQVEKRGPVTGMLKDEGKPAWSSAQIEDDSGSVTYSPRVSKWIRHTVEEDRTSGVLRLD
jgi:hypothetical protein